MENSEKGFVISMDRFKPHTFQAEQGEGLFMSHSHEYDELTLILEGEGYYSSSEQNIKVAAGDLILIPPRLHHGFVCTRPWQGISVHFFHDKLPAHCQYLFHETECEPHRIRSAHLHDDDMRWAEISFFQLEKEWKSERQDIDSYNLMRIAFETTLLLFQRNRETWMPITGNDYVVIEEVLKEIHSKYHTQITVNELAARHFISESSLRKKFSESFGVSPKQYIISLRLMESKRLLQQTNKAIESISAEVGFTSSSRFYEFFIKSTGVTPLEWRKKNQ
ncbi:helix-turn-helix transcriptional regulator [Paenibacillus donghaensis]|uniref:helix-turn-helix domain-containing protein n=1 Tax=Paenibacillus donghaensis TaxID=414771 RepID=UPI0018832255|nr:AraC family transcriptional regulator [Paenibacillus donghaensis]MBE9915953.1 helix-turn-helix transcriptional regulator [Paenibacillus donghaensis]